MNTQQPGGPDLTRPLDVDHHGRRHWRASKPDLEIDGDDGRSPTRSEMVSAKVGWSKSNPAWMSRFGRHRRPVSARAGSVRMRAVLTASGRREYRELDTRSQVLAEGLIAPLRPGQRQRLAEALTTADRLLSAAP